MYLLLHRALSDHEDPIRHGKILADRWDRVIKIISTIQIEGP